MTGTSVSQVRDREAGRDLKGFCVDTGLHRALEAVDDLGVRRGENR